jgi:hypothetical protein
MRGETRINPLHVFVIIIIIIISTLLLLGGGILPG